MAKKSLDDKYKEKPDPRAQLLEALGQKAPVRLDSESRGGQFTLVLPLPPRELSPNARCHWRVKNRAKCAFQDEVQLACIKSSLPRCNARSATVQRFFYFPVNRRRDADNHDILTKCALDQLVKYGLLSDDDQITYMPTKMMIDKENPRLELVISIDNPK